MNTDAIRLLLNGEPVAVTGVPITTTLLSWLRTQHGLTGTKEGCAEGDCGACTIVVGELTPDGHDVRLQSVNACIQFVPALDGKAVFTVEHLRRQAGGALHPVQQALVDCHGSQCGFCTPGFVMSLWDVYNNTPADGPRPDAAHLRTAVAGNLCRCTGYRPIIEAGERMFDLPSVALDRAALREALAALGRDTTLAYACNGAHFFAPRSIEEFAALRAERPAATILAGCTDIGLWVNKQFRDVGDLIYVGNVAALREIGERDGVLRIGAGASLTDAYTALAVYYPELTEMWARFASPPVRNAGTLGGNVANGSPIGDSMPALIALGASVVLRSQRGARRLALEDFYLDYMKKDLAADEFVETIDVPLPATGLVLRTYKLAKRYDSDISAVCAAFAMRLDGGIVRAPRIAFGGMAATPKRALRTEAALDGRAWNEATLEAALAALDADYTPLTDLRASAGYRRRGAANLLRRFHLETRPEAPLGARETRVFAEFTAMP